MTVLSEIKSGLRKGHFQAYYQPMVDAETKKVKGFEALVRWHRDGNKKLPIAASEFIDVALSNYDVMKGITSGVIYDVIVDFCSINSPNMIGQSININSTISMLLDEDIYKDICFLDVCLKKKDIKLVVEITENENIHDFPDAEAKFLMYRNNGITFAIDDFKGRKDDFELLKISMAKITKLDKSIINRAGSYHGFLKMCNLISMLRGMGQAIVAEGVKSQYEEFLLASTDVDLLQGYRYGHALHYEGLKSKVL